MSRARMEDSVKKLLLVVAVSVISSLGWSQAAPPATGKPEVPESSKEAPQQKEQQNEELGKINIPKLPEFNPQQPKRIQLANGMVVFLQEDHELPLIGGTMRIRGGALNEPAEKVGLSDIYGSVWRTGGTKTRTGDQLDDFLEARAAKLETGANDDSTVVSFNCLKGDFDDVFSAFRELLLEPAFREDKIDLIKRQLYGVISRRNDDSDDIAGREATKLAYGKDSPLARVAEYSTVAAVTRQDLVSWHQKYVHPANIIFGIYGDFDSATMEQLIHKTFDQLPKGERAVEVKLQMTPAKPGIYFAEKIDVDQSSVQLVGLGIERKNPDFYAVSVMNEILSGGFASRLVSNLRSKLGLAYSVGGGVGAGWDHLGMQNFAMGTKSASTKDAIVGLKKEISDLVTSPPTTAEMKRAKDAILNSFVFNFDSKEKVLAEKMRYEFYGYPLDFLERYRAEIDKVTVGDVNRVAKKYLHPDNLATLVVGNPGEIGTQLSSLGSVSQLDITIPPPPGASQRPPAAPQATSK